MFKKLVSVLVIVAYNLTNKLQPLDITINQKAKKLISHKFTTWKGDRVSNQLKRSVATGKVKVLLKMSVFKSFYSRWIVEIHDYLKQQKGLILIGFNETGRNRGCQVRKQSFHEDWKPLYRKTSIVDFFPCSFFLTEENHWDFPIHVPIFFLFLTLRL